MSQLLQARASLGHSQNVGSAASVCCSGLLDRKVKACFRSAVDDLGNFSLKSIESRGIKAEA
jgi:hypothetical protein